MTIEEFREWQERLKMRSYYKLSVATGFSEEELGQWNRGEAPIPLYVRLTFAAVYHRLNEVYS